MAAIPKAAKTGGKTGGKSKANYPKASGGSGVKVSNDRGGRRIGPTRCAASGSAHTYV